MTPGLEHWAQIAARLIPHFQRSTMIQISRPLAVTVRATGEPAEAMCWQPADPDACGAVLGWLFGHGVAFHHPSGTGETTTLALDDPPAGHHLAQPGDWIVRRRLGWTVVAAGMFDTELEGTK